MKSRQGRGPPPSTDLLVCFPTRAHLSLMPKPICSPARPSDSSTHRHNHRPSHRGSPVLWAKTKHSNNADISEPTSPKVTCAGQIKVRSSKPNSCKNWQSVMEEIERMHNSRKQKKRPNWIEAFGFKKDVMQFLTCLRNIRFDFRCFGSIPAAEITSDEDDEEEDEEDDDLNNAADGGSSGAVFSKWFMILQEENLKTEMIRDEESSKRSRMVIPRFDQGLVVVEDDDDDDDSCTAPPPPNALLLMRCRSAPAKSWLEEREEEEEEAEGERSEGDEEFDIKENGKKIEEETNLSEFAIETATENRIQDKISRSRSCKR